MTLLTVDVGNSSIGLGRWQGDDVVVSRHDDPIEVAERIDTEAVAISVQPERLRRLLAALTPETAALVRLLRDVPMPLGDPRLAATAGSDRLAGAVAMLPGPGIIVDAGTAVTVDLVDADGVYRGGFIAAGPSVAAAGLADATAQLPELPGTPVDLVPGGETESAIASGVWGMAVGGTDRLVQSALERLGPGGVCRLIATGAWGAAWAAASQHTGIEIDPVWVHRGMRRWAERS